MKKPKELKMKTVVFTTVIATLMFLGIPISCQKDDVGDIVVYGKVIDSDSKEGIPNVRVKVDGVTQFGYGRRAEAGNTYTNTDGTFNISIKSRENAAFYEFFATGESSKNYTEASDYHGEAYLDSITKNKIPMIFELSRIEPLRINLKNTDPINDDDYVCLHFYSDNMGFRRLKTVENFGTSNLENELHTANDGLRTEWVGSDVNSVINANILVNEELSVIVTIMKNGQLTEIIKLINGKRNRVNEVDIDY